MAIDAGTAVKGVRWLAIIMVCACCATCTTTQVPNTSSSRGYALEKLYGVKASQRVAHGKKSPRGRGRYVVGKPYVVKGKRYYPREDPNYDRNGVASRYSSAFRGRLTANGEVYFPDHLSAAHPTLPLPSYVRVTNLENGSSVIVRVNDRGPYHKGRIIDLSGKAADMLDLTRRGTVSVRVQYVGRARPDGNDMPYLMASYARKGDRFPAVNPVPQVATGVMVAQSNHVRSDSQSLWSTQTNLAGNRPSASHQTGSNAEAAFQTSEKIVMLPERPSEYTRSMSRNAAIASADQDAGFMSEARRRIGMVTAGDATVRDVVTLDVNYCLDQGSDDAVRDMCELQVLPLPGVDRNRRLTGVFSIRRRRLATATRRRKIFRLRPGGRYHAGASFPVAAACGALRPCACR
ncbi:MULTISPECIES: septal ring lytic transglycosylase RlpA family protein [unclassified Sinorhizobium]|uniref:septal ring lytic transglycosylase RlpA family protein n=1 Tax=unclassified Sinorhizobium TaxID=2613772 RepID=UPI0024C362B5|nr:MULTISPECIES: septal ring lytic transglycosylase RlpA family protein [unclassified Sinorhizobium]MDK1373436.1 septal ring lytic transglycosylase RlpA family protein [Sinorhizobium sp. 6-70]MDK1481271.1 septal ring lytic transglycosylase RlpA family protein [Sinorhizobium sp. 6-117]